ncbi:MAG: hypothetical protein WCG48_04305 [Candidatus Berkelbacteria bacterium]
MIEIEKRYLLKTIPERLAESPHKNMIDIYVPAGSEHPKIRFRKNGDKYEITKKAKAENSKHMEEQTIAITAEEFDLLEKEVTGKRIDKIRYKYNWQGFDADVDIFQGDLLGLAMVDFEFEKESDYDRFSMPPFCLFDLDTIEDKFMAGGLLCGKKYSDLKDKLISLDYKPLSMN